MPYDGTGTSGVQRFEVFTGAGKRRNWPPEVKVSIIAENVPEGIRKEDHDAGLNSSLQNLARYLR